jgi:hypothetical protein
MLGMLSMAHARGQLQFLGNCERLADTEAFKAYLALLWKTDWFAYANARSPVPSRCGLSLPLHPPCRHPQQPADLR